MAATLCASILAAAAKPATWFFHEPRLGPIVYLLALAMLIDGLQNIRIVEFRKEMRFDREFLYLSIRRLSGIAVTLTAAALLRNEWALVIGIITGKCIGVVLGYTMRPYLPRLTLAARGELLAQSGWLFVANMVQFVRQRSSDILIGRIAGTAAVGAYVLGSDMATAVSSELVAPINRVALPEFSNIATREGVIRRFDQVTGVVAVFLTPAAFGLAACAPLVVAAFLGSKWAATAQVLQILAFSGWIAALGSNLGVALLSLGHYTANASLHGIAAATLVPLLAAGAYLGGAPGVAVGMLIANTLAVIVALFVSRRLIGYRVSGFLRESWRPVLAATVMYGTVMWVARYIGGALASLPSGVHLAMAVLTGAVVYPTLLYLLWIASGSPESAERSSFMLVLKVLRRVRPPPPAAAPAS
jgi:O-antigen/teichoic acid export membrane protein